MKRTFCLGEEAVLAALAADFAPESLIELGADNLPLLLGVSDTLEAGKEMLLAVQPDKVHVKELGEGLLHEVALVLPHQTLIHKHAGQLVAHGTGDKPRRHRAEGNRSANIRACDDRRGWPECAQS